MFRDVTLFVYLSYDTANLVRQEDNALISTGKANMVEAQPHRVIKNAVKAIQDSCVITGFEVDFCQVCHSPGGNNGVNNFIAFYVQVIKMVCIL